MNLMFPYLFSSRHQAFKVEQHHFSHNQDFILPKTVLLEKFFPLYTEKVINYLILHIVKM